MNDTDRDLIAALAEGRLTGVAADDVLARIESDPDLAAEYADQVAALSFLQSAGDVSMTTSERSTLHANLTEQLGLTQPKPVVAKPRARNRWLAPVFGLATAAAVFVAIVIVPGSQDVAPMEASAQLDGVSELSTETSAAAGGEAGSTAAAPELSDDADFSVYETDSLGLDELIEETEGADSPQAVKRRLADLNLTSTIDLDRVVVEACINDLDIEIPDGVSVIHVIGADVSKMETIVHLGFDFGDGVEDGLSFILENCSLVEHAPQG